MNTITIGKAYIFNYPESFVTLPAYSAHRGQLVTVTRQLTEEEASQENEPMYEIKASDGWVGHADASELTAY